MRSAQGIVRRIAFSATLMGCNAVSFAMARAPTPHPTPARVETVPGPEVQVPILRLPGEDGLGAVAGAGAMSAKQSWSANRGTLSPVDIKWGVELARKSILVNLTHLPSGSYLTAGSRRYHALWTRDFAFSTSALLRLGFAEIAKKQLNKIVDARSKPVGLVPVVLDSDSARWRAGRAVARRWCFLVRQGNELEEPFQPDYGTPSSPVMDSNALVLLAALDVLERTGDISWWRALEPKLVQIFHFYDRFRDEKDGLVRQGPFADWQDGVSREGKTFYVNLLVQLASEKLARFPAFGLDEKKLEERQKQIDAAFYDPASGVYKSLSTGPYVSLDGNLLALDRGYFSKRPERARSLYSALKKHPLWQNRHGVPGVNTSPAYPKEWSGRHASWAGLGRSQSDGFWGWIMALSAKAAFGMGDVAEGDRLTGLLLALMSREGGIAELYAPADSLPVWKTGSYEAEMPHSWSAAAALDLFASAAR